MSSHCGSAQTSSSSFAGIQVYVGGKIQCIPLLPVLCPGSNLPSSLPCLPLFCYGLFVPHSSISHSPPSMWAYLPPRKCPVRCSRDYVSVAILECRDLTADEVVHLVLFFISNKLLLAYFTCNGYLLFVIMERVKWNMIGRGGKSKLALRLFIACTKLLPYSKSS